MLVSALAQSAENCCQNPVPIESESESRVETTGVLIRCQTTPSAVYASRKGSSAAGLTASVIRDAYSTREFYREGGCYGELDLSDGHLLSVLASL